MTTCRILAMGCIYAFAAALSAEPLDTWLLRNPAFTSDNLSAITLGDGRHVTAGWAGTVLVSSNAISWATLKLDPAHDLLGIGWGSGLFVAVGKDSNFNAVVYTSSDALNWVLQQAIHSPLLVSVAYGNGRFVAIGGG